MPDRKEHPIGATGGPRQGQGLGRHVSKITLAVIPVVGTSYVVHLPEYLGITIYKEQYLSVILTLMLVSTFLGVPAKKHGLKNKTQWYDWVLALLSLVGGGYVALYYPDIIPTLGYLVPFRTVMGAMMILLLLETTRRLVGWPIVIVGLLFPIYAATSYFLPGFLHSRMIPVGRVLSYLYLAPGAMFGIPLTVAATIVFSFIFFGRILFITGGGKFLSDFALALMGRYRGGPAKVAILASCFFGSLSGSASANVAMTGIVTIPLMKRTGYKPHMAGAIEAVASTGGLIMPPIMAATAFIMAEFLEIPYPRIALSALIPAVLYYVAVFIQVHLQAVKTNLRGLPRKEIPSLKEVMAKGWIYVIPVGVLLYCLFGLYMAPEASALYAVAATVMVCLLKKDTRQIVITKAWNILEDTGRGLLEVGIICTIAGIVIGSMDLTGIGLSLSDALVTLSGGNVMVLLVLAAAGAIILGMGMPVTATYIMLVVLIAPALIQLGIEPMAAHLFIMYFGVMSFLTPPVAIAAYVASSIAQSDPMRTGFAGVRLGIVAYIVPFVFVLSPSLILLGRPEQILLTTITAFLGIIFLSVALEGYLFAHLHALKRLCFGLGAMLLIAPSLKGCMVGAALTFPLLLWEVRRRSASPASASPGPSGRA